MDSASKSSKAKPEGWFAIGDEMHYDMANYGTHLMFRDPKQGAGKANATYFVNKILKPVIDGLVGRQWIALDFEKVEVFSPSWANQYCYLIYDHTGWDAETFMNRIHHLNMSKVKSKILHQELHMYFPIMKEEV